MSNPGAAIAPLLQLSPPLDHQAWMAFLCERLLPDGAWRPGEFDQRRWLFTGDPDNPMTTSMTCRVARCATVVASRCMCNACERAMADSGLDEDDFVASYRPALRNRALSGDACVVVRDGQRCERRRISNQTGLCQAHSGRWNRVRDRLGITLEEWCQTLARPLPARPDCMVTGCQVDARLDVALCGPHYRLWRLSQAELVASDRRPAGVWAATRPPRLRVNQFSLASLEPTVRVELLYVLQQRDAQGQRIDPVAIRSLVSALAGVQTLVTVTADQLHRTVPATGNVAAYLRQICRILALTFEEFRGIAHTDGDVWDCLVLELTRPRPGRRPNTSTIDFSPISQRWLKDASKHWVATVHPETNEMKRALQAATLVSVALSRRPGGGQQIAEVGFAEVTAAYEAIKEARRSDGQLYDSHYRRGLWARFWAVIDFGRASGILEGLPGSFVRNSSQHIRSEEANEDEIGKAIPETVIAQLDAHLDLLGTDRTYGRAFSANDTQALFQTAYVVLRDTGRRPGEVVSLSADCLDNDGGEWALVYDNHKKRRLRRRLPITTETAAAIQVWQDRRAGLDLPVCAARWLFPACNESSGPGHLGAIRLAQAIHAWVEAIPVITSDLPGPDGAPLPFDRSLIYPYAFRHSYAQRHADAGVNVEVLQDLMDHKDMQVTQGYYKVGLKRKRQAVAVMSRYVHDRTGTPQPGRGDATSYQLRSVAVPFGNCIEPSNVKAGGKACPIRFQCAGCGFYRPDPSYLPAIEEHINALRADRETAMAIDADEFVVRNLTDQADAFAAVAQAMRDRLAALPEHERAEVEAASATLRKMRASASGSAGRKLIPLRVENTP